MKLAHLQLVDPFGNPRTLIARLDDGSIKYTLFTGLGNYGTGCSLEDLEVGYKHGSRLPLDNERDLTVEEWCGYLVDILNNDSMYRVENIVPNTIKFR